MTNFNKSMALSVLALFVMIIPSHSANVAKSEGSGRENGIIARIGAGAPANFNIGGGYRFSPHISITGEVFSYSGLTTFTGVIDARYHILDKSLTPFVAAKIGYGSLGMTIESSACRNGLGSLTAGYSWRGFDLGAGIIYDTFHKMEFTAYLSWTYCLKRKRD